MPINDAALRFQRSRIRGRSGFAIPDSAGGGSYDEALFAVPLNDAGSGIVTTTLRKGTGSGTFTRATAAAARTGVFAAGVGFIWNLNVASGSPRSHYDVNGVYLGYLSESAATQVITDTRDLSQISWVKVNMTSTLTSTGLENVANSCSRVTCVVGGDTILQTATIAAATHTFSAYVKRVTGTGTVTMNCGSSSLDITALINTNTFTLVQLTDATLNAAVGFTITTAADAIDVDCAQLETGSFATTPIPVAGTRNADSLTYAFAGNASATVGTCRATMYSLPTASTGTNRSVVSFATANQGPLFMLSTDAPTIIEVFDGTNTLQKTALSDCSTLPATRISAWSVTTQVVTGDGKAVSSGAFDGNMGSTSIGIGCDSSGATQFNGCVRSVSIWTQRFGNDVLQTMSQS